MTIALVLALPLACPLLLGACSDNGGGGGAVEVPGIPESPPTAPPPEPAPGDVAEAIRQSPVALSGSALDAVRRTVTAAQIATAVVRDASDLITDAGGPSGVSTDIDVCPGAPAEGQGANRVTLNMFGEGFPLPPGRNINIEFEDCPIEDVVVSGTMDISALEVTGEPGRGQGGWRVEGLVSLNGLTIRLAGGDDTTILSNFSKQFGYTAELGNGVLTTALDIESANVERNSGATQWFNHLLEPFYIEIKENRNSGRYVIDIKDNPTLGPSVVTRYVADEQGAGQGGRIRRCERAVSG